MVNNTVKIMHSLGWQGGTIHQLLDHTGLSSSDILDLHKHNVTVSYDYNQGKLFASLGGTCYDTKYMYLDYKYNKDFWKGVIDTK